MSGKGTFYFRWLYLFYCHAFFCIVPQYPYKVHYGHGGSYCEDKRSDFLFLLNPNNIYSINFGKILYKMYHLQKLFQKKSWQFKMKYFLTIFSFSFSMYTSFSHFGHQICTKLILSLCWIECVWLKEIHVFTLRRVQVFKRLFFVCLFFVDIL